MGIPDEGAPWGGIALAHNVGSRAEVHDILDFARRSGAEVTREAAETFYGGYAPAFVDPDGHPGKSRTTLASAWTSKATSCSRAPDRPLPARENYGVVRPSGGKLPMTAATPVL